MPLDTSQPGRQPAFQVGRAQFALRQLSIDKDNSASGLRVNYLQFCFDTGATWIFAWKYSRLSSSFDPVPVPVLLYVHRDRTD